MFSIAWQGIRILLTHFELQKKIISKHSQTPKIWQHTRKKTRQSIVRWLIRNQSPGIDLSKTWYPLNSGWGFLKLQEKFLIFSWEPSLSGKWKSKNKDVLFCFNKVSICLPATKQKSFFYTSCIGADLFSFSTWQQRSRVWKPEACVRSLGLALFPSLSSNWR